MGSKLGIGLMVVGGFVSLVNLVDMIFAPNTVGGTIRFVFAVLEFFIFGTMFLVGYHIYSTSTKEKG